MAHRWWHSNDIARLRRTFRPPYCQVCLYHHMINHKYSCSGVFNFILASQAPYEDIQEEDCLMSPAGTKRTSQSSYVVAVSSSMCHALLDVPACYAGYRQPCIGQAPGANWWWWWWEGELCARTLQPRERVWAGVCLPPYCQVCLYHHMINHKYSCSGVFNFILASLWIYCNYILHSTSYCCAQRGRATSWLGGDGVVNDRGSSTYVLTVQER